MREVVAKARALVEWALREGNIRDDLPELLFARVVIEQDAELQRLSNETTRMQPVYMAACAIRDAIEGNRALMLSRLLSTVDAARKTEP